MPNPLRYPDPKDPFSPLSIINESDTGTRHPNRFEPTSASIPGTQLVRNDAARWGNVAAISVVTGDLPTFDTKSFDTVGLYNGTKFIIPSTGKVTGAWLIKAQITWPGTGAGTVRKIQLRRNTAVFATKTGIATTTSQDIEDVIYDPARGDQFDIQVTHDAGGALALTVGSDQMFFSLIHIG